MIRREFLTIALVSPVIASDLLTNSDIYLSEDEFKTLKLLNIRFKRLKKFIGYANFGVISYRDALYFARNYSSIGVFTENEVYLMERLFYEDPSLYGFYGAKTVEEIDTKISKKDIKKVPRTGHYLFKGKALEDYKMLRKDVGSSLVLTSGVRGVIKQMSLYVNKIYRTEGNMTLASRSIAPPAYSYHSISDFDVGKVGWGHKNFTSAFASTKEFNKMIKLDYINMRYTKNNKDGVRFEPWHVEVI